MTIKNISSLRTRALRFFNVTQLDARTCIVLVKMFSWWFFASKKLIIMSTALKLCDIDVSSYDVWCNIPCAITATRLNLFIYWMKMQLCTCLKHFQRCWLVDYRLNLHEVNSLELFFGALFKNIQSFSLCIWPLKMSKTIAKTFWQEQQHSWWVAPERPQKDC